MQCFVYIVKCSDGTLYTGWTTDVHKRVAAHNGSKGAKYTKPRLPVELVYYEQITDKSLALQRECAIKKLTRQQKQGLLRDKKNLLLKGHSK